ncbi:membrane protein insertase YidC [Phycicoccus duodecadis]|uniref:Membrane protein insertase YidC n=1 Tax=Phycicoccus duodecadis TaxID=173053 RepID=A0A2N3YM93_9MICO|nr:membrane protein insertase YidC [Phycicoccus duodecadis]PKW27956.1 YidC/Oxa1 family membrane protein insertase [Phycicoccus duodecadis]
MGDLFNSILAPIEWLVAWIMFSFHQALTAIGMPEASGWTWGLSIVGLVIVMRAAMIPLFVKQIKASRKLQLIQPEMQKIQKKYKGKTDPESRQAMTQETMDLYKKEGTNPFSSCLPILVQSPFFFGLFRVLNGLQKISTGETDPIGPITKQVASQAEKASIFGAQLSDHFLGADRLSTQIVTIVLIVLMSATTFTTQRQLMTKNMPQSALDSPFAKQQKMLLYIFPVVFAVSGVNFPIGVLIYWFTTNVWSMTQQFYVIRRMPAPGSAAERAYHERLKKKGKAIPGAPVVTEAEAAEIDETPVGQRVQPKSKKRAKGSGKVVAPGSAAVKDPAAAPAAPKTAPQQRAAGTVRSAKSGTKSGGAKKPKKSGQSSPSAG